MNFTIANDLTVNRLGFGAMRITGKGVWGLPDDLSQAMRTLERAVELGVNFIDTADSYGPFTSEQLIAQSLYPYKGLVIATKGGFTRQGPNLWEAIGRAPYLRQCVLMSMRRLRVDRIDLWQLHRIDENTPRHEQFEELASMQQEGLIKHIGLSEVDVDDIKEAQRYFTVATVQNQYNLIERKSESVLDYCEQQKIGFIPWYPLAAGALASGHSALTDIARKHDATPSQIALAWILRRSPVMLPIPGTSNVAHLEENMRAADITLTDAEFRALDDAGRATQTVATT